MKELKQLLSSNPMLTTIKPKLTGSLREPISAHKPTSSVLEALRRLVNLLTEAGLTAGTQNVQILLECNYDRVIAAGQSLFKTLSPHIGVRDSADNLTSPIGTTDDRSRRELRWIRFSHRSMTLHRVSSRYNPIMLYRNQK